MDGTAGADKTAAEEERPCVRHAYVTARSGAVRGHRCDRGRDEHRDRSGAPSGPGPPEPSANDDQALWPEQLAYVEVLRAPVWQGTEPVAVVIGRDGAGRLVEQFDGRDGVRCSGRRSSCASSGYSVREIVEGVAPASVSEQVAERQRRLAAEAWRAW